MSGLLSDKSEMALEMMWKPSLLHCAVVLILSYRCSFYEGLAEHQDSFGRQLYPFSSTPAVSQIDGYSLTTTENKCKPGENVTVQ